MSDLNMPQRFLDLAKQTRGPRALSEEALSERFGELAEIEIVAGQVWRARWNEVSILVLVLAVEDRDVLASPVTIDPPVEDDRCVVLEGSSTAFGVEARVWAGLTCLIPIRVLDRPADEWSEDVIRWATHTVQGRPSAIPPGARQGRAIQSELDPAAMFRAELADELELLSQAPGLPVAMPSAAYRDLASLLGAKLDLASLCSSLDLPQSEVMKLLRGKIPLTPDQIAVVAQVAGLSYEEIAGTVRQLPLGLVVEMEHPRWRPTWVRRAQRLHISEDQARLTDGYKVFALAARETGGAEPDWGQRLRQFLHEEETSAGDA
ncbi:MAG: hypothetical protein ACRDS9_01370 [Pseudonocardiaceae bacterium]